MAERNRRVGGIIGAAAIASVLVVGYAFPNGASPTASPIVERDRLVRVMPAGDVPLSVAIAEPRAALPTPQGISREQILERAYDWLVQGVPYNQQAYFADMNGDEYRTDCSGFVAMALNLDPEKNFWTGNLDNELERISWDELRPGDIVGDLGRPDGEQGHVVIFEKWANEQRTKFVAIDQRNSKVDMAKGTWSVGAEHDNRDYLPYRYPGIVTSAADAAWSNA